MDCFDFNIFGCYGYANVDNGNFELDYLGRPFWARATALWRAPSFQAIGTIRTTLVLHELFPLGTGLGLSSQ